MMGRFSRVAMLVGVCVLSLLTACVEEKQELGSIAGFISDANSGEPLRAVDVTLSPEGLSTVSGSDGRYEFQNLKDGRYTIQASKSGYISNTKVVNVAAGVVTTGDMMLTASSGDMSLSVSSVDFGTAGSTEQFQIVSNAANGSFEWTISKQGEAEWLAVSPTSGSTGAGQRSPVTLTVDRTKVTTTTTVVLRVTNITSGNSISLPVSVGFSSGTLQVMPSVVDFGNSATSRQLTISNTGSTTATYEVDYNCAWLTVSPTQGVLQANTSATIALAIDRTIISGEAQTILQVRNTADGSSTAVQVKATNSGSSMSDEIVVASGLRAYYTFDDGTANDLSDNGADAMLSNGATTVADGSGGQYLQISSTQASYLNIPYNLFSGYSYWTVSFWAKDITAGVIFAAQYDNPTYTNCDLPMLKALQSGMLAFVADVYTNFTNITYDYVSASGWHHYVLTMSNAGSNNGNLKFYVDGVLTDNLAPSYSLNYVNNCTRVVFGGDKNGQYDVAPSMKLDNIRIYGRTLSTSEIQTIYNNEL